MIESVVNCFSVAIDVASMTSNETNCCDICMKSFPAKNKLMRHKRSVHTDHNWKCQVCAKAYKTKGDLNKHTVSHNGERIECVHCGVFVVRMHTSASKDQISISIRQELLRVVAWLLPD